MTIEREPVRVDVLRVPTEAEIDGLATLIEHTAEHDHHAPIGEHALAELKQGPRLFPHAAYLAKAGDELAGYAHLSKKDTPTGWRLEAFVAPEHRRHGIGTRLVRDVLDDVARDGGGLIHVWAYEPGPIEEWMAVRFGGRLTRALLRMSTTLPTPRPDIPAGFRLRPFEESDAEAWVALHNEVFIDHPDAGNWKDQDIDWHIREPWFDPSGFILAEDDDGLVGYCWMKRDEAEAWVYFLGVHKRARRSGLSRELCLAGFAWGFERGARRGVLYVDENNTPAVRLYQGLGMAVEHVDHCYEIEVAPTRPLITQA